MEEDKVQEENTAQEEVVLTRKVMVPAIISVKELADIFEVGVGELITELIKNGVMATINQDIDFETAQIIGMSFGIETELEKTEEENIKEVIAGQKDLEVRPPIVAIMGHVDHGKTSLLDAIRKTSVVSGESGGITQHIGAYQVEKKGKKITFLDTPGHEAFIAMRARGAKITDIIILVVAADDGVRPQTKEAWSHAQKSNVPVIVAITKIDKEGVNLDKVKGELAELGLTPEDWGGKTITVPVSAQTGEGLDDLLEMILLMSELEQFKSSVRGNFLGTIVESHLDKGRGPLATILVSNGTLKQGDILVCGPVWGKVRALSDWQSKKLTSALPSVPVQVSGLSDVATAGDVCKMFSNEKIARNSAKEKEIEERKRNAKPITIVSKEDEEDEEKVKHLNIILKTDVNGSLEAIASSVELIGNEEVKTKIVQGSVGNISESDILLAESTGAIIYGFGVQVSSALEKIAERKGVKIKKLKIIYEIIDDIHRILEAMLEPEKIEKETGTLDVLAIFREKKGDIIFGGKVKDGFLEKGNLGKILRNGEEVFSGKITDLRILKEQAKKVEKGFECGVEFKPEKRDEEDETEIKVLEGDTFVSFVTEEKKRTL